jgi:dolichol-phosphate mannosyltransferase
MAGVRMSNSGDLDIAVVIPCHRVAASVCKVIASIAPFIAHIICIDDGCPENSGDIVEKAYASDPRVHVIRHDVNKGVGAAVVTGYREALRKGAQVIVKIDGDGQMDASQIPRMVAPIIGGHADYSKGNRFFSPENVATMPWSRIIGNAGMSFLAKASSGYWEIFDPANGFTAIHAKIAEALPLEKLSARYFFESDILFRLNTLRAVVIDIPMAANYGEENSGLSELHSLATFPLLHARNFFKRIAYNYFIRDFNIATLNMVLGLASLIFGVSFGITSWHAASAEAVLSSAGTVMLAGLPIIVGTQLFLNFLAYDMSNQPSVPIHIRL